MTCGEYDHNDSHKIRSMLASAPRDTAVVLLSVVSPEHKETSFDWSRLILQQNLTFRILHLARPSRDGILGKQIPPPSAQVNLSANLMMGTGRGRQKPPCCRSVLPWQQGGGETVSAGPALSWPSHQMQMHHCWLFSTSQPPPDRPAPPS